MLDHVGLRVADFERAMSFYRSALAPIGYGVLMEFPDVAGLGAEGKADLWIMKTDKTTHPTHIAFTSDRESIDAFHIAAIAAGGTDNGAPGLRLDYHPNYYAAFVTDPEGNNIEVVCHEPPRAVRRAAAKARRPAKKLKSAAKGGAKKAAKKAPKAGKKAGKRKRK